MKRLGYAGWIDEQIAMAPSLHLPELDRYARFAGARGDTTYGMMPMEMMAGSVSGPLDAETRTHLEEAASIYSGDLTAVARAVLQVLVAAPEFAIQK